MQAIRSKDLEYPIPLDARPVVNRIMVWRCDWRLCLLCNRERRLYQSVSLQIARAALRKK